ncbi:hypothetical protein P8605_08220 [Streptomyces sp. T-3]|nr:hypothetical protein [Streptomyces sp. T-3]
MDRIRGRLLAALVAVPLLLGFAGTAVADDPSAQCVNICLDAGGVAVGGSVGVGGDPNDCVCQN